MLVSTRWLVEICPVDSSAERIARWLTDRGLTVDSIDRDSIADDIVLDVDVPANRPDCLGHRGIARELAAASGEGMRDPVAAPETEGAPVERDWSVRIDDAERCRRFTVRLVRGVRVGPSPEPVRRRLEACGLRSINNVVDASNLVLLELGQPIHFYDAATLPGREIVVRRAYAREKIRTLDDVVRELPESALVIADDERAIGVAGVMGGAETEIGEATTDVLIEAAWFDPRSIRRTARALALATDASHRFERGCDPEATISAQDLACSLLAELASGVPAPGLIDTHPNPLVRGTVELRHSRLARLLGYDPGRQAVDDAFGALQLPATGGGEEPWRVEVPSWRADLEREADLVEEVARHLGYDEIPSTIPALLGSPAEGSAHPLEEPARDVLAHLGFHEAFNYAMVGPTDDAPFVPRDGRGSIPLANPISDPLSRLRRSILSGLVTSADRNMRRGIEDVRLFEAGRVFLASERAGTFPEESLRIGLVWTGAGRARHWSGETVPVRAIDLAGVVERLLTSLRPAAVLRREPGPELDAFHPGDCVGWASDDGGLIAWAGSIHPELRAELDLGAPLRMAEIDLDRLARLPGGTARYRPIPRVPAVSRDLSVLLRGGIRFEQLIALLESVPSPAPCTFDAVDRYVGEPLAPGEVSLTVRVILQPLDRTLTDEVVEEYRHALIAAVEVDERIRLRG